jgi:hypothetical protein
MNGDLSLAAAGIFVFAPRSQAFSIISTMKSRSGFLRWWALVLKGPTVNRYPPVIKTARRLAAATQRQQLANFSVTDGPKTSPKIFTILGFATGLAIAADHSASIAQSF